MRASADSAGRCINSLQDAWEQILNTNLRGVYYTTRAFAPMMIRARAGHIINISSLAGRTRCRMALLMPLQNGD